MKNIFLIMVVALFVMGGTVVVSYNNLVSKQEAVGQAWGQVQATYQRRLDLVPNLVATVKGYAQHENSTLTAITNARAQATQRILNINPDNAQQLKQLTDSQANLTQALGKLMVVVENYPNLKASENFLTLQAQLEGSENRITVARENFNEAARDYNSTIRSFPSNIIASFTGKFPAKPYFDAQPEAGAAPRVSF